MAQYEIPQGLYYTSDHAWVKVEENKIRIGITDFMQKLAGEITFIRIPRVGKTLAAGATLSSIQSGKWAGKIQVPMSGTVLEANTELPANPKLLNSDSYGAGWICVMEPDDLAAGLQTLIHGDAADAFFTEEHAKYAKPE
ncbi:MULTISPECIES: glycine cleavage system protein H [Sporomusa]|uniref:Glycine cleavage system H protein n=1 Tax=Sporomusa sphaeroides DSM 2875 TaxID=1337886 RepID=A0ABP2CFE7_9FIRM|nr:MULTISPECIES: glycine cleavage system protein H [Sporomusa]MCM0760838.1 glycine cleavage system protein H [Sporomusa sphaeroides DSM 2875]OLS55238.1 glycine cleavage system H protein [Sporomusa sphaeroides DSM 2875]CVK21514.1 Glycine cleavage system H protein [Sporomusa sphaeroides DSM 2875]HML32178.1 glycine cleavage system protein H [Sporomusa sphaeroides]